MPFGYEVVALEIRAVSKGLSIRPLCSAVLLRSSATSPQAVFLVFRAGEIFPCPHVLEVSQEYTYLLIDRRCSLQDDKS
uniref:Uncharacterized protein n=1 Tax=Glossina pallidipes TaxID=7398 RepID=A0A1A9Z0Q1_GLOPL